MPEVGAARLLQELMAISVTEACQIKTMHFRMFRGWGLGVRSVCCIGSSFLVGPKDLQSADHPRWVPQQFISVVSCLSSFGTSGGICCSSSLCVFDPSPPGCHFSYYPAVSRQQERALEKDPQLRSNHSHSY